MSQTRNNEHNNIYNSNNYVPNEFEERFDKNYMEFYENGFYDIVEKGWRRLGEEARLEVMQRAFRESQYRFIDREHFSIFPSDLDSIKNKITSYSKMFGLTEWECNGILTRFKGGKYEKGQALPELALYSRLKEYVDFANEIEPLSLALLVENHRIFRCEASRTAARVKFLQEVNPDIINDEKKFVEELLMFSDEFNIKYQAQMEKKISTLDAATYKAAVLLSTKRVNDMNMDEDEKQYFQYDNFLELALKVAYGDRGILDRIEKIKQNFGKDMVLERHVANAEELEDISIIEMYDMLPKSESINPVTRTPGMGGTDNTKKQPIDKEKITEYINYLKSEGIECNQAAVSDGGTKAPGEDYVTYYVFNAGEYRILEAVGQPGNATLVVKAGEQKLSELLKNNTRDTLIEQGVAYRMKHKPDGNKEYKFNPTRLKNIITLVNETVKREIGETDLTIDELINQVTQVVPKEELAIASKYIDQLSRQTAYRYIQKTAEIERKTNPNTVNPSLKRKRGRPFMNTQQQGDDERNS